VVFHVVVFAFTSQRQRQCDNRCDLTLRHRPAASRWRVTHLVRWFDPIDPRESPLPSGPSGIAGDVDIPLRSNVVVLKSTNARHKYFGCTICNGRVRVDKQDKIGGIVAFQELHADCRRQCRPSQSTMDEFVAPIDRSPARRQPEEVERARRAAEFERDRASVDVHRLLAMTVRETTCWAEASVEVTDFHRSLVELGPGHFGTGQTHTSGCHWARCTPHTVPLGLRDARRLCPEGDERERGGWV
jgi:hypothetical protein